MDRTVGRACASRDRRAESGRPIRVWLVPDLLSAEGLMPGAIPSGAHSSGNSCPLSRPRQQACTRSLGRGDLIGFRRVFRTRRGDHLRAPGAPVHEASREGEAQAGQGESRPDQVG